MNTFVHFQYPGNLLHQLPPELLCKIFLKSLSGSPFYQQQENEYGDVDMTFDTSRMTTPFTLSAVCHQWRMTAFAEPSLWSFVYLVATPRKAKVQAYLLEQWLHRSGTLPLTIEIDTSNDPKKEWSAGFSTSASILLRPVFRHSPRCTTFRTRLPPSCLLPHSQSDYPNFINLTTLTIFPEEIPDAEEEEGEKIELFRHATNLRHIEIREVNFNQLIISWTSVVKVTTSNLGVNDCLHILRSAPHLEECSFEGILWPEENQITDTILLSGLKTLFLDFGEMETTQDIITRLVTAPNLEVFEYITEDADEFPTQQFGEFVTRSNCSLTYLSIKKPSMTVEEINQCLSQVSRSLEFLSLELLSDADVQMTTFEHPLHVIAGQLPRLKSATFSGPTMVLYPLFNIQIPQL
ncbi:hypothetical protein P691DRAFT_772206 [Macrolepiota fuliginosa MF-IS2]|uniref:F-box domain-containing protein n=1 Tax=Macrolepiota fuliginosa MF-IS2 TaxID=1400762 RepID=A0A9P5XJK1_9AGAR|nr:hypothetical protein P691DRAFT_772206 [Macrolepiota fuliginosa MF-IS2]